MARVYKEKNLLLIGDLSFIYDLNALIISNRYNIDITIVVINNNGGRIFSNLSISEKNDNNLTEFWITPHGLSLKKISELFNAIYYEVQSTRELKKSLQESFKDKGISIIDANIDISKNTDLNNDLVKKLKNNF